MQPHRFVFILEQTLGHVSHSQNLERALARSPDVEATIIKIPYAPPTLSERLTARSRWAVRASIVARNALRKGALAGAIDGIFVHTYVCALLLGRRMRAIPTVVSLDATPLNLDSSGDAYRHRRQPAPVEALKHLVHSRSMRRARRFVAWSDWASKSLISDYGIDPHKVSVIHPGVDLRFFCPSRRQPAAGHHVRALFVGADFERKGGTELLAAVATLDGAVELDVVTRSRLVELPPYVRVHNDVEPHSDRIRSLYQAADIFVLPTRGECFGQVVAEAMACELPVITTRVGAMPELVEHGETGFLVSPRAPAEVAAALRKLVENPPLRGRMGRAAGRLARRRHDADMNVDEILNMMRRFSARGLPQIEGSALLAGSAHVR